MNERQRSRRPIHYPGARVAIPARARCTCGFEYPEPCPCNIDGPHGCRYRQHDCATVKADAALALVVWTCDEEPEQTHWTIVGATSLRGAADQVRQREGDLPCCKFVALWADDARKAADASERKTRDTK